MSDASQRKLHLDDAEPVKPIQVAGTTNPKALAGSITEEFRQALDSKDPNGKPSPHTPNLSLHAIGHQAVGQALKAVPIANGYLAPRGIQLTVLPTFEDREVTSEQDPSTKVTRTVMRMRLIPWMVGG